MTPLRACLAAAAALALTACGPDDAVAPSGPDRPSAEGCAAVRADEPVATAAGKDPALSMLVEAVTAANLVDELNSQQGVTVLAPADQAFEALPADDLDALLADRPRLTSLLGHHVLEGRLTPDQLAGEHTTMNGDTVTVERSGGTFTVAADGTVLGAADARILCGGVRTANATVYVIDRVLVPAQ